MARELSSDDTFQEDDALVSDHELIEDRFVHGRERALPRLTLPPLPPPPLSPPASRVGRSRSAQPAHEARPLGQDGTRDDELRDGAILADKYRVIRSLGEAGVGAVLLVRHLELDQHLLFKYLPRSACAYPETVARFLKGARGAQQLTSEHAARTLDAGRLPSGIPYVVTEFLEGSDVRDVLEIRGSLPISEAVDWILQTAAAVAEAHRHGLVHGALNPSTLFVAQAPDGSALIKVMEFGVGHALRADPLAGAKYNALDPTRAIESLSCTAPEQIRRADDVDARTDVWALGALLFEALTGVPAYRADTVAGMLAMIVADPAPILTSHRSDAPAALERVILRCLEKERSARYASVAELAVALKLFASPESQGLAERITRTLGRSRRPQAGSAGPHASHARTLVHVPSAPTPASALPAPSAAQPLSAIQRYQAIVAAGLVALGLFAGNVASSFITRHTPAPAVTVIERALPANPGVLAPEPLTAPRVAPTPREPLAATPPPLAVQTAPTPAPPPEVAPALAAVQPVRPARAVAPAPPRSPRAGSWDPNPRPPQNANAPLRTASATSDQSDLFDDVR